MVEILFESNLDGDAEIARAIEASTAAGRVYFEDRSDENCDVFTVAESAVWEITPRTAEGWIAKAVSMLASDNTFGRWHETMACLERAAALENERRRQWAAQRAQAAE